MIMKEARVLEEIKKCIVDFSDPIVVMDAYSHDLLESWLYKEDGKERLFGADVIVNSHLEHDKVFVIDWGAMLEELWGG